MTWLARNKKTGLPAGTFPDEVKREMEIAPEYAGILAWEKLPSPPKAAPKPKAVKKAATKPTKKKETDK